MSSYDRGRRPRKEAFFVQVKDADDRPVFFDATDQLGKPMPYAHPLATCALRVHDDSVALSMLRLTARSRQTLADARMLIPRGPLTKLERRVASLVEPIPAERLVVDMAESTYEFTLTRDENGVGRIELVNGDDVAFELPRSAVQLTMLLASPRGGMPVAIGFIGHIGKPGAPETLTRAVSYALNSMSTLPVFRLVTGIETMVLPAPPTRYTAVRPQRTAADEVTFTVPVRLWSDTGDGNPEPVAQGFVAARVDLDTASPVTGRLLFHFTPDAALAEMFDQYRSTMEAGVAAAFGVDLGPDQVADLVYDIVLGSLDAGGIERLKEAAGKVGGLDLSPRQFSAFEVQQ